MSETRDKQSADEPGKKKDDPQRPLVHEGASADRHHDSNEGADDKVEVVEPDGASSPRNRDDKEASRGRR